MRRKIKEELIALKYQKHIKKWNRRKKNANGNDLTEQMTHKLNISCDRDNFWRFIDNMNVAEQSYALTHNQVRWQCHLLLFSRNQAFINIRVLFHVACDLNFGFCVRVLFFAEETLRCRFYASQWVIFYPSHPLKNYHINYNVWDFIDVPNSSSN